MTPSKVKLGFASSSGLQIHPLQEAGDMSAVLLDVRQRALTGIRSVCLTARIFLGQVSMSEAVRPHMPGAPLPGLKICRALA